MSSKDQETIHHLSRLLTIQEAITNKLKEELECARGDLGVSEKNLEASRHELWEYRHDAEAKIQVLALAEKAYLGLLEKQRAVLIRLRQIAATTLELSDRIVLISWGGSHWHNLTGKRCFFEDDNWKEAVRYARDVKFQIAADQIDSVVPGPFKLKSGK